MKLRQDQLSSQRNIRKLNNKNVLLIYSRPIFYLTKEFNSSISKLGDMNKTSVYSEKAYSSFTTEQIKIIDNLIGKYGTNRADVVRTITICWLENKGLLLNGRKKSRG